MKPCEFSTLNTVFECYRYRHGNEFFDTKGRSDTREPRWTFLWQCSKSKAATAITLNLTAGTILPLGLSGKRLVLLGI